MTRNQKPFYMCSHSIELIIWLEKEKNVCTHDLKEAIQLKFLFFDVSDDKKMIWAIMMILINIVAYLLNDASSKM